MLRKFAASAVLLTFLSVVAVAQNASYSRWQRVQSHGRGQSQFDHVLGFRPERELRPEQEHRHAVGADRHHADHGLHAHDRFRASPRRVPSDPRSRRRFPARRRRCPGTSTRTSRRRRTTGRSSSKSGLRPWGFLKGAAANNATVRQPGGRSVVSLSPAMKAPSGQAYTVTGYINNQNLVEKVETRVEHPDPRRHARRGRVLRLQGFRRSEGPGTHRAEARRAPDVRSDDHRRAARIRPTSRR